MKAKVSKWGNSLGLRIPQWIAEQAQISEGVTVEVEVKGKSIIIIKQKPSLDELMAAVTTENLHSEVDTGDPVGSEAW